MKNQSKGKELLSIIAVTIIVTLLHHEAAKVITSAVADTYLSAFLGEALFAVATLVIVVVFKKTSIYRSDIALLKKGWTSAGLFFVLILFYLYMGRAALGRATATFPQVLLVLGHCFLIGFCEETLFRGLVQRAFHAVFKEDSFIHVFLAVLCSGVIFGLVHLTNSDLSKSLLSIVFMSVVNIFSGMYYCAIYFRTGKNIWYNILLHGLYDLAGMIVYGRFSGVPLSAMVSPSVSPQSFARQTLIYMALYLLPTLFILRPKKIQPLLSE